MLVFGHRGACGYLPENTLESFRLAFELGADAIEFDVVLTSDGVPVVRHDDDLSLTTNILSLDLASKFAHQITFEELSNVRATERYEHRTKSKSFDGQFRVPALRELLQDSSFDGRHLILELKYGKFLHSVGLDLVKQTAQVLRTTDWKQRGIKLTIECFEFSILRDMKNELADQEVNYVFLSAPDMLPAGANALTKALVSEIAIEFDGLSVAIPMLFDSDVIALAKEFGLPLYAYTARVETAPGNHVEWFKKLAASGIQGIFADQPDLMIQAVRGNA
ncbi:MAG: hypothetical protein RIS51_793 [Actinomycetota bacterium]